MNLVRISGGLGSQMFRYAFYLAQKAKNPDCAIEISYYLYHKDERYELNDVFPVLPVILSTEEVLECADVSQTFWARLRRALFGAKKNLAATPYIEKSKDFDPDVFDRHLTYFCGAWQSWKYFDAVVDEVRKAFKFKRPLSSMNAAVADAMAQCESVSIHIRRGDRLEKKAWNEMGSICSLDYYNWAIANVRQQLGDEVHFFVFSDDIAWARENLKIEDVTYIDWNKGGDSAVDMQLMSLCKHNIIANSSFSWWAAYLNANPDKIVIAPARWYRSVPTPDILPPYWIQIPIDSIVRKY